MTLETILSGLSRQEKLQAMDLLWQDLSRSPKDYDSPDWHQAELEARLSRPAAGKSLPLDQAKAEVKRRLDARRAQG